MLNRSLATKVVSFGLILALQGLYAMPALAVDGPNASLTGTVFSNADEAGVGGATVHVGNPATGDIVSSTRTTADGSFAVKGLAPATYELAVESDGGLYLVSAPVRLAPGQARDVHVAINPQAAPDPATAKGSSGHTKMSLWSNPLTASLVVLGSALVVGVLVDEAIDDDNPEEPTASPAGF